MKKLLLITNLFVFCSFAGSCQTSTKTSTNTETKPKSSVTPTKTEAVKSNSQTSGSSGSVGTGGGIKKDTASKPTKTVAVNHSAPNQAQIDSLKKTKTKNKKKK